MVTMMRVLCVIVVVLGTVSSGYGFLVSDNSCEGRCDTNMDRTKSCQCNSACVNYKDCCSDYSALCLKAIPSACRSFTQVTEDLWNNDADRLSTSSVQLNYQSFMGYTDFRDKAANRLFTYVDEREVTSRPVFSTYLTLLDNYDPDKYDPEHVTAQERAEEEAFLDAILATPTINSLYQFLLCKGKVQDRAGLRAVLRRLWFELYARGGGANSQHDTSGFEHVMVGEYRTDGTVNGLHYWLAFHEKERSGLINYYGHTCQIQKSTVCAAFEWNQHVKRKSTFFLRSSPAFDIAVYSLCFLMYPEAECPVRIDGEDMTIQSYSKDGHVSTVYIK